MKLSLCLGLVALLAIGGVQAAEVQADNLVGFAKAAAAGVDVDAIPTMSLTASEEADVERQLNKMGFDAEPTLNFGADSDSALLEVTRRHHHRHHRAPPPARRAPPPARAAGRPAPPKHHHHHHHKKPAGAARPAAPAPAARKPHHHHHKHHPKKPLTFNRINKMIERKRDQIKRNFRHFRKDLKRDLKSGIGRLFGGRPGHHHKHHHHHPHRHHHHHKHHPKKPDLRERLAAALKQATSRLHVKDDMKKMLMNQRELDRLKRIKRRALRKYRRKMEAKKTILRGLKKASRPWYKVAKDLQRKLRNKRRLRKALRKSRKSATERAQDGAFAALKRKSRELSRRSKESAAEEKLGSYLDTLRGDAATKGMAEIVEAVMPTAPTPRLRYARGHKSHPRMRKIARRRAKLRARRIRKAKARKRRAAIKRKRKARAARRKAIKAAKKASKAAKGKASKSKVNREAIVKSLHLRVNLLKNKASKMTAAQVKKIRHEVHILRKRLAQFK